MYFDSYLAAIPKDEINHNLYKIFEKECSIYIAKS